MPDKVAVTYAFGQRDRVDKKLAPFGVLKQGKNLRVLRDGRLGCRTGYQALPMTTRNGTLVAYDLHEYRGRLCALGSDTGDGYPTDLFEYTGNADEPWRGTDPVGQRVMINPFSNLREIAGIRQSNGAALSFDAAVGDGYACLAYVDTSEAYVIVVRQSDDQTIAAQKLSGGSGASLVRVAFAGGVFYVGFLTNSGLSFIVRQFTPGTDTAFQTYVTPVSTADPVSAVDMVAVTNATTARLAVAYDRGASRNLDVKIYQANATQLGSTFSVAGTTTVLLALEADQADNTINLFTVEGVSAGKLRTFNFSGSLLVGPTATTSGFTGSLCRLVAQGSLATSVVVIVDEDGSSNAVAQVFGLAAHAVSATITINQALCRSRPLAAQSANQAVAFCFSGIVAPKLPSLATMTNALFFVTPTAVHMTTRDFVSATENGMYAGLSRDSLNDKLAWLSLKDPGIGGSSGIPTLTLLDLQSTERRQSARFGGLLYFAGGTPSLYDGRFPSEILFGEFPGVQSVTPSNGAGHLTNDATYVYVVHFERVLADGSVEQSEPSDPYTIAMGASDDTNSVTVSTPHSIWVAAGDDLYGADVTAVLSRTVWDSVTGEEGSAFLRAQTVSIPPGMANYGKPIVIVDTLSDADLATKEELYTQAARGSLSGPLPHDGPQACRYITATESRLITGGLTSPFLFQTSFAAFTGEVFSFSNFSQFFGLVSGEVLGVHRLDRAKLVFTEDAIFAVAGDGPDDVGGGGFGPPVEIPSPSGLKDWRSFLEEPGGLWFQLDGDKLFRIPRGGGAPEWVGVDVRSTLATFPTITGACRCRKDNAGLFACNTDNLGEARVVVTDFRTGNFMIDFVPLSNSAGVAAITSFGDTVAYASGGNVYVQNALNYGDDDANTFIDHEPETQPLYPFTVGGYGQIYDLLLTGELAGPCTLTALVSYDDGKSFTTLSPAYELPDGVMANGDTVQRKWTLPDDATTTIVIKFSVTAPANLVPSAGFIFTQVDLLVQAEDGLRELLPGESA